MVTEGGAPVVVTLEAMRHVNLETFLLKLHVKHRNSLYQIINVTRKCLIDAKIPKGRKKYKFTSQMIYIMNSTVRLNHCSISSKVIF